MLVLNFILAALLFTGTTTTKPQECDAKPYKDKALRSIPDGYTFLKSYTVDGVDGTKKEVKFSYIFTKNNNYTLNLENGIASSKGMYVVILDSNGKPQTSSFATSTNKYYSQLSYKCSATGMYHITFKFTDKPYCAGAVLSFKR
ncbi:MAG: hypothetical protein EAZ95_07780 [Bacteroidetes bacterium]|nr:MAG: hypothetical protein EAZ95_07780 [Bacteroidota bacterium]